MGFYGEISKRKIRLKEQKIFVFKRISRLYDLFMLTRGSGSVQHNNRGAKHL
jgi:hypothetical protein